MIALVALLLGAAVAADDVVPPPTPKELPPEPPPAIPRQLIALLGSGGYDVATRQPYAAVDAAFHHDGTTGFAFEGRVQAGWAFFDNRPLVRVEAGFMGVVPAKQLVRLGVVAGTELFASPYQTQLQVGGPPDGRYASLTFLPYGALDVEVGGLRPDATKGWAAWAVGVRLGAGVGIGADAGCGDDATIDTCTQVRVGFAGGLTARLRFHEGAYLEVLAGPTAFLGVGYAF